MKKQKINLLSLMLTKNSKTGFVLDPDETSHTRVYGVETEIFFSPAPRIMRFSHEFLSRNFNWRGALQQDLFNFWVTELSRSMEFLQKVENDGDGNLEFVTYPSSLEALKIQSNVLIPQILQCELHGFNSQSENCGIHVSANVYNFGVDWEQRIANMRKLLFFCFYNSDVVNRICKRSGFSQRHSDITYLLGDSLGTDSFEELLAKFNLSLDYTMTQWEIGQFGNFLNIYFNRPGVSLGVVEFRWFASTNNSEIWMSFVEFIDSLIMWVSTVERYLDLSLESYITYIDKLPSKYPNIVKSIKGSVQNSFI